MSSLHPECNTLKAEYDECFTNWYTKKYLKGVPGDDCKEIFSKYKECVWKHIKKLKIDSLINSLDEWFVLPTSNASVGKTYFTETRIQARIQCESPATDIPWMFNRKLICKPQIIFTIYWLVGRDQTETVPTLSAVTMASSLNRTPVKGIFPILLHWLMVDTTTGSIMGTSFFEGVGWNTVSSGTAVYDLTLEIDKVFLRLREDNPKSHKQIRESSPTLPNLKWRSVHFHPSKAKDVG